MNLIEFTDCLQNPRNVSKEQTKDLENMLQEYPYFQSAQFLYLNGLKNQHSYKYNNYLKKTAAYTTDRTVLFNYISSDNFNIISSENKTLEKIKIVNLEIIEEDKSPTQNHQEEGNSNLELPIGKPLQFDKNETFSFNQWLNLITFDKIERDIDVDGSKKSTKKSKENKDDSGVTNQELIDKFISSKPLIKPSLSNNNFNIATNGSEEDKNLMTETLAHVYLEQKKYNKAITAFQVLSLKYPEKSSFFANQIEAVKKLQDK